MHSTSSSHHGSGAGSGTDSSYGDRYRKWSERMVRDVETFLSTGQSEPAETAFPPSPSPSSSTVERWFRGSAGLLCVGQLRRWLGFHDIVPDLEDSQLCLTGIMADSSSQPATGTGSGATDRDSSGTSYERHRVLLDSGSATSLISDISEFQISLSEPDELAYTEIHAMIKDGVVEASLSPYTRGPSGYGTPSSRSAMAALSEPSRAAVRVTGRDPRNPSSGLRQEERTTNRDQTNWKTGGNSVEVSLAIGTRVFVW